MTGQKNQQSASGSTENTDVPQDETTQQQFNSGAQQQAATNTRASSPKQPTAIINGQEVPYYAAPRSHSSDAVSRLAVRAFNQAKNRENPGIPTAATPEALASAKYIPMPAGGLSAVVDSLFPQDKDNQDAMDAHLYDLMLLNRDTLRDDTSYVVGQMIKVPA